MSYNFQIFEKFSLGHAKSWSWGREFEKILNFFFNSSRAVLFSEGQKNICWASQDVEFHKLSAETLDNFKNNNCASVNHMKQLTNFLRCNVGKKFVPVYYREHISEKSRTLEKNLFLLPVRKDLLFGEMLKKSLKL